MKIDKVIMRKMYQDQKVGFRTSFGVTTRKEFTTLEIHTKEGAVGYGDCSAFEQPWYNEETRDGAFDVIQKFIVPTLLQYDELPKPEEFFNATDWIRRNRMARAAVDCALWDLYAQDQGVSVSKALGGTRSEVETGVSLGIEKTPDDLCRTIEKYMGQGYRRVKIKIGPGHDIDYVKKVRQEFGDIMLMCDANSAYRLTEEHKAIFKELDQYNLLMIEQPLASDDIIDHRHLQAMMKTRICLDESIDSAEDARKAIELGSCKTINIKVARVGGLTEAKRIHDVCAANDIPVWCGGMLDTGIARCFNVHVASLPNYKFPHDIPGTGRYYKAEDEFIEPAHTIDDRAMIQVPTAPGMGYKVRMDKVEEFTEEKIEISK